MFGFIDMSAADSQRKSPTGSSNGAGNASGAAKHNKHDLAATVKVCSEGTRMVRGRFDSTYAMEWYKRRGRRLLTF